MGLTGEQKKYIRKNIGKYSPEEIGESLGIREKEIINYLGKKLSPEKLKKILSRFAPKSNIDDFNLKSFILENRIIFFFLFIAIIIVYGNSLNNDFVSDDIAGILTNPDIGKIEYVFSSFTGIIQRMIFYLVSEIFGLVPFYFRLFSIFFHIGTTFLVFSIMHLLYNKKLAIIVAFLFAVHPILVESVAWISGHPYVENGFFFLFSFFLYLIGKNNKKFYYFSVVFFLLSIISMERGFVMFSVFFLYEWFFGNLKENLKKLLPFFGICFFIAIITLGKIGSRISDLQSTHYLQPGTDNLLVKIPTSVATYFKLIFWPKSLSLYQTEMIFSTWQYQIALLVFIVYLGTIIWGYFKCRPISFWLIFFLIPISTTLSPLRIAWAVAERYVYLSTLGIIFVVGWIIYKFSEKRKFEMITFIIFWIIFGSLATRTIIRNFDWKNEESLWFATAKTSPSGPNIHNNLGYIYFQKNENEKALEEFQKAIDINPTYGDAYHNLGNTYYQMKKIKEAEESYRKAIEINPNLWQSHQNLAVLYHESGRSNLAIEEIKKAMEINPDNEELKKNYELLNSENTKK